MKRMKRAEVLLSGLGGLGVEIGASRGAAQTFSANSLLLAPAVQHAVPHSADITLARVCS